MTDTFDVATHLRPIWLEGTPQEELFPAYTPLVAHYCSISTLESIVKNNEFWFSNPLYANDYEELSFGMFHSRKIIKESTSIRNAFQDENKYTAFIGIIDTIFQHFEQGTAMDLYIACFSIHNPSDNDGLLSMWRGYGANGTGAAIVFNTAAIREKPDSPLVISKVQYGTTDQRISWIINIIDRFAELIATAPIHSSDPNVALWAYQCATQLFERLLTLSIFTKHIGFQEERELRVVYFRHRDVKNLLSSMASYAVIDGTVHPKFKFKIAPLEGFGDDQVTLDTMVVKIILGPSGVSSRSVWAVKRMLATLGHPRLAELVVASSTPYRSK
ncbi:DUF2971 domain-containing protein [Burkholderia vietnamiensis]|uniref:DUF2971 domain-containing protein n=1 Tax=Burkholderia vietnamiensis TaxID=60552 RepID=UPI001ADB0D28|nr:DUF2971 domain-containing protein [Burkholderia vietnamiensis]MDN7409844.1 DUF2971 domain-containing protein [Burkholderia vietnamiensis]QTK86380.1 DUF2971 domain-containing protein [Burkholderia vietnamiensis]